MKFCKGDCQWLRGAKDNNECLRIEGHREGIGKILHAPHNYDQEVGLGNLS